MSADTGNAIGQFENVGKAIQRLQRVQDQLIKGGQFSASIHKEIIALKQKQAALLQTERATKALIKANNQVGRGSGKMAQALGQASFAAEDFISVFGTMGFAGGMRAAGNNLSMIGHILGGPLVGGLIGVGSILGGMWLDSWLRTEKVTKDATEGLNNYLSALKKVQAEREGAAKHKLELDSVADIGDSEAVKKAETKTKERIDELKRSLNDLQQEKRFLGRRFAKDIFGGDFQAAEDALGNLVGPDSKFNKHLDIINERFANFVSVNPENLEQGIQIYKESITDLFDDIRASGEVPLPPGIAGAQQQAISILAVENRIKQATDSVLENKERILEIDKRRKELQEQYSSNAEEISQKEELVARMRVEFQRQRAKEEAKAREERLKGYEEFKEFGKTALEKEVSRVQDQLDKMVEAANRSIKGLPATDRYSMAAHMPGQAQKVGETMLEQMISDLEKEMKGAEKPIISKGRAIEGQILSEQAAQAKSIARAQMAMVKDEKKDSKRKDLLDALNKMLDVMRRNKTIAHQVGP
jgi:hypothetical protein